MKQNFLTYIYFLENNVFLTYLYFCGRGLKGRAGCRQTEVQTNFLSVLRQRIGEHDQTERSTMQIERWKSICSLNTETYMANRQTDRGTTDADVTELPLICPALRHTVR